MDEIPSYNPKKPYLRPRKQFSTENQPANRGRKPGSLSPTNYLKKLLAEKNDKELKLFGKSWLKNAKKGYAAPFNALLDRIDGHVPTKFEGELKIDIGARLQEAIRKATGNGKGPKD